VIDQPVITPLTDFTVYTYDTLPSTQIMARERLKDGLAKDGDAIVTLEQTAGYGRRGRMWKHQPGNVYLTLTRFFTPETRDTLPHYGFLASLALAATCRDFLQNTMAKVIIKWPNDVLVNDAKIAGILLERVEEVLLLGVGVNLVTPQDVDQQVIGLDQFLTYSLSPQDFIPVFLQHLKQYEDQLKDQGFAAIRDLWLSQAKGQGQAITARLANSTVLHGTFLDLDQQGALLLDTGDSIKTITSADIFFTES
jgi:BirA family biotin operon repressor/biotin-[acetyl-CoA-carboxylase] ligase